MPARSNVFRRRPAPGTLLLLAAVVFASALYFAGAASNPPGFYLDESSIAYNAHLVARTGRDEHGERLPLFFRAFGEYKNPVYIYLLAAVYKLAGPSAAAARYLSAALGVAAALFLGLLGARVSGRRDVGAVVTLSALLTPWLFESARLVFEVAAFPAAVALLLLAVERASRREAWGWGEAARVAAGLALITYTYSVGRALGPLLAAGLLLLLTRARLPGLLKTWALYAAALAPLAVFAWRHPGALTGRFELLTYFAPGDGVLGAAAEFARHYLLNLSPRRLFLTGEENPRTHLPGAGVLLWATAALVVAGLVLCWRGRRRAWWGFVVCGLLASVVPASLTSTEFPQLRLLAFPVFLHALTVPAWSWLFGGEGKRPEGGGRAGDARPPEESAAGPAARPRPSPRRFAAAVVVLLVVGQGLYFQWLFRRDRGSRGYVFDDRFARKVLEPALACGRAPVYLLDVPGRSGYVQALWHGVLRGVPASRFARLAPGEAPPAGSVVVSTEETCARCRMLVRHLNFIVYTVIPSDLYARPAPLAPEAFRAELRLNAAPAAFKAGRAAEVNITVRHAGAGSSWPSVGGEGGRFAVSLRNRWLRPDGSTAVGEDSASAPPFDLEPGDVAGWNHAVNAPAAPGDYLLELDLVQEGVARFAERGSAPLRLAARVEE